MILGFFIEILKTSEEIAKDSICIIFLQLINFVCMNVCKRIGNSSFIGINSWFVSFRERALIKWGHISLHPALAWSRDSFFFFFLALKLPPCCNCWLS